MINVTNILPAAFRYKKNRDNQTNIPWDKGADAQYLMEQMMAQGLRGVHGCASSYFGTTQNGRMFVVDIGKTEVFIGEFSGFDEWMEYVTR